MRAMLVVLVATGRPVFAIQIAAGGMKWNLKMAAARFKTVKVQAGITGIAASAAKEYKKCFTVPKTLRLELGAILETGYYDSVSEFLRD